ncbi:MAG: SGNH/GDSL hydrolase family protein [Pyrinomonadaceae bacterium]
MTARKSILDSLIFTSVFRLSATGMLLCLLIVLSAGLSFGQERIEVTWYNAADLGIAGRGWTDTNTPYDRLPKHAEKKVPEAVWKRGSNTAGMTVPFATDASMVIIRWKLRNPGISTPYLSSMSVAGLDLYLRKNDTWFWAASKPPEPVKKGSSTSETTATFLRGLSPELREYLLYLPIYNGVESVEIGVPAGSRFGKTVGDTEKKPIVFYGSSIVQGSASSRPGMTYVSQLGRRLDNPVVNLGFSGLCHMEPEMADLLAELDPAIFVIDCLPNMKTAEISERTVPLVKKIRQARPDTPIVFVENPKYSQALWNPVNLKAVNTKNELLRKQYDKLLKSGVSNLHYVKGEKLYGMDGNTTVDGVHPTDYGFTLFADALEPVLRGILEGQRAK